MNDRPTTVRYRVLVWLTLIAALSYLCRNAVGVAESSIREDLGLSLGQSGWFMGSFFYSYALCQIPSGWFSQRYGTRISLTLFIVVWSIAAFCIGIAPGLGLLIAAQLMMGVAQAGAFPAACNSIGHWMPVSQRSMACGILAAGMQIGAIAASSLAGKLLPHLGWRWVFVLFAIPGIISAAVFLFRFRDQPDQSPDVNEGELALIQAGRDQTNSQEQGTVTDQPSWLETLARPALWFICLQQICRAAGYMFFASWFPTYLQHTRGLSVGASGYIQSLVFAGTLTGSVLGGTVTDWVWRRTNSLHLSRCGVAGVSLLLCALLILAGWSVESTAAAAILLTAGSFFAGVAGPCAYSATIDIGGKRVPQVFGLMNMCGNLSAAAVPSLVGALFEWTPNWDLVLLLFAGVYLMGAICWIFVRFPQVRTDLMSES